MFEYKPLDEFEKICDERHVDKNIKTRSVSYWVGAKSIRRALPKLKSLQAR